ncbi:MAG: winged helix-turn-helix domain-containing protein [Candidatus Nanopelagicaceae bacterium]
MIKNAWGDWYGDTHMIECHVSRIRSKVKKAGGPHICQAVHGVGYRLGIKDQLVLKVTVTVAVTVLSMLEVSYIPISEVIVESGVVT